MIAIKEKILNDKSLLKKQLFWVQFSYDECIKIGIKKYYEPQEFGKFETLCSRYSRGMDFLIRKIFRTLDEYEFENQGTLIDVVNNAHKRNLFDDIDLLRQMKDLRNTISHEYIEDEMVDIFDDVLEQTKNLIKIINKTISYIDKTTKQQKNKNPAL